MILVDTNVVSELLRTRPDPTIRSWLDHHDRLFTTSITVQEMYFGVDLIPPSARRTTLLRTVEAVLTELFDDRVLPYDAASARHTAATLAFRRQRGAPMSTGDAQIAGIALVHGATVATRNTRDFAGLPLAVVNPWLR